MNILLAFDKFKDSMTAAEACGTASEVLLKMHPTWNVRMAPLTDGGEGFCEILTGAVYGDVRTLPVLGPRLNPQEAKLGFADTEKLPERVRKTLNLAGRGKLAIVEMAQASGLEHLPPAERDPWKTSSFGTGQLIGAAADAGARAILLGVGGSATQDIGLGALEAIGLEILDTSHTQMDHVTPSDWSRVGGFAGEPWPHIPSLFIACDVENPLLGPNGCTRIFGPQKGLNPDSMVQMEKLTGTLAKKLCDHFQQPHTLMAQRGAGAAGGIAFGLAAACDARILSGSDLVRDWLNLEQSVQWADYIVTGEGKFDQGSLNGKGPGALLKLATARRKPVKILAGLIDKTGALPPNVTIEPLSEQGCSLEDSIARGKYHMARRIQKVFAR